MFIEMQIPFRPCDAEGIECLVNRNPYVIEFMDPVEATVVTFDPFRVGIIKVIRYYKHAIPLGSETVPQGSCV